MDKKTGPANLTRRTRQWAYALLTTHMLRVLLVCVALAAVPSLARAQFGWRWIGCPAADKARQVWFRHTTTGVGEVEKATLTLSTTGFARAYVNGRLVDPSPLSPSRRDGDHSPRQITWDVSAFMVSDDTLNVALWCAQPDGLPCAVAARLDCRRTDGTAFAVVSDSSWLCRPAPVEEDSCGTATFDSRQWHPTWSYGDTDWARWTPVAVADGMTADAQPRADTPSGSYAPRLAVKAISTACETARDAHSVHFDFGHAFVGFIRVTLRDAVPGEAILVGDTRYICSGLTDEQLIGRFRACPWREVTVSGDGRFKPSQVQAVEGLEIGLRKERCQSRWR